MYIFTGLPVYSNYHPFFFFRQPFVCTFTGKFILSYLPMNVVYNNASIPNASNNTAISI